MNQHVPLQTEKLYYGFPVILVSYYDGQGKPNLATMSSSFSLGDFICLGFGAGGHAVRTVLEVREFAVNVPDRRQMAAIEMCGFTSGAVHDKFALSGLTPTPCELVHAPVVAECPIVMGCRVEQVVEQEGLVIVTARILERHVGSELLDENGHLHVERVDPVLFVGDGHERVYRYVRDEHKAKGSFLPTNFLL